MQQKSLLANTHLPYLSTHACLVTVDMRSLEQPAASRPLSRQLTLYLQASNSFSCIYLPYDCGHAQPGAASCLVLGTESGRVLILNHVGSAVRVCS